MQVPHSGEEDRLTGIAGRVRKPVAALLLRRRIAQRFDTIVTGASPKRTWVRSGRDESGR